MGKKMVAQTVAEGVVGDSVEEVPAVVDPRIRVRAKSSGTPRPELGFLTGGAEYLIDPALFDAEIFDRVTAENNE